ncbi:Random slug protein 5 [Spatholobus suberectus]|nr:Random slug protein 5 [Spatholobus suberectus]
METVDCMEEVADEAERGMMYRPNYYDKYGRSVLEQVVWLVDFQGFKVSGISFKVARETAYILQEYYPKRLGLAILYNGPMIFQPFFSMVKPLLETETYNKIKFGYSNNHNTQKIMEDFFDMDNLESAFSGNGDTGFDINKYAERMKEDAN